MPKKIPKQESEPYPQKIPKIHPVSFEDQTVHWSFAVFDGSVDWHDQQHKEETFRYVAGRMRTYESMTWRQIKSRGDYNHAVPTNKIIPQAQKRLRQINQDDVDELWRFRFDAKRRIWGIRDGRLFKVLWWDPQHKICPSRLKHT